MNEHFGERPHFPPWRQDGDAAMPRATKSLVDRLEPGSVQALRVSGDTAEGVNKAVMLSIALSLRRIADTLTALLGGDQRNGTWPPPAASS